ncbi:hypothetical protein [Breoghania sp.]|uniref:hypothetical protein n=1 Tax=Breoghania sp. TaxID=2065378 RepID=UPI002616D502|nr:hypothetical protein [Breoghania sp.]MDJ0929813.1 hypothetical protein [Breoghania sp.]
MGDTLQVVNITGTAQTLTFDAPGDNGDGFTVSDGTYTADVDNIEKVEISLSDAGGTVVVSGDFANSGVNVSTIHVEGGAGADTVNAAAMTSSEAASNVGIAFNGNGGDDAFISGVGNDTFDGGADTDTAEYGAALTSVDIALDGTTGWTVTTGSAEGTDTLSNVEIVDGAGTGRFLLVGNGGFETIQAALDAAVRAIPSLSRRVPTTRT